MMVFYANVVHIVHISSSHQGAADVPDELTNQ